jgi:hypothetical protein
MLVLLCGCFAQPTPRLPKPEQDPTLPGGPASTDATVPGPKAREMIVKNDYKKNLQDSAELARLAEELKTDLENGDKNVVSVKAMKNAEDIEKLARNIRNRLKRY